MFDGTFYRGTNSLEWSKIKSDPSLLFKITNDYKDYSRWLAAKGIYFFYENYLQAKRFAYLSEEKAKHDLSNKNVRENIESVVVKARLKKNCKSLNLYSSSGLNELYKGHTEYHFNAINNLKNVQEDDFGYKESLKMNNFSFTGVAFNKDLSDNVDHYAYGIYNEQLQKELNIESKVITSLCTNGNYDIVVAAVQENITFNEDIHNTYPITRGTNGKNKFRGFGYHDHIEVCVLNPDIIIEFDKCDSKEEQKYERRFIQKATM